MDEAGFNINMRSPNSRSVKGTSVIVETHTTRANTHITAQDAISVEVRESKKVDGSKKRKKPVVKKMTKGTVTGHNRKFISKTLDQIDNFELRNLYAVMNNVPIHTSEDITRLIEARGHSAIYLFPYSPELNLVENFWLFVKNSVKRSVFQEVKDLKTRISEASESVSRKTLHNITQHSVENFQNALIKNQFEPLGNMSL
jgi:transposase